MRDLTMSEIGYVSGGSDAETAAHVAEVAATAIAVALAGPIVIGVVVFAIVAGTPNPAY